MSDTTETSTPSKSSNPETPTSLSTCDGIESIEQTLEATIACEARFHDTLHVHMGGTSTVNSFQKETAKAIQFLEENESLIKSRASPLSNPTSLCSVHLQEGSLEDVVKKSVKPSLKKVLSWMMNLSYGISEKLVDRDIKPDNLFLPKKLIIGDFGISTKEKQMISSVKGTYRYMAPEQHTSHYTESVDVWAMSNSAEMESSQLRPQFTISPRITSKDRLRIAHWESSTKAKQMIPSVGGTLGDMAPEQAIPYYTKPFDTWLKWESIPRCYKKWNTEMELVRPSQLTPHFKISRSYWTLSTLPDVEISQSPLLLIPHVSLPCTKSVELKIGLQPFLPDSFIILKNKIIIPKFPKLPIATIRKPGRFTSNLILYVDGKEIQKFPMTIFLRSPSQELKSQQEKAQVAIHRRAYSINLDTASYLSDHVHGKTLSKKRITPPGSSLLQRKKRKSDY